MFIVIYHFAVKTGRDDDFRKSWAEATELIYKERGSLGSRLHHAGGREYVAYAQWPSKTKYEEKPSPSEQLRKALADMSECIERFESEEMTVVEDLWKV